MNFSPAARLSRWFLTTVLAAALTSCFTSSLSLENQTTHVLTPYPVVTQPPPPHREADPAHEVLVGQSTEIDTNGFNPVFYSPLVTDVVRANGIFLGLALYDDDPPLIQYKLFHYKVPPGQAGTDPALQPILIMEEIQEIADEDTVISVIEEPSDVPGVLRWKVVIAPAGS